LRDDVVADVAESGRLRGTGRGGRVL